MGQVCISYTALIPTTMALQNNIMLSRKFKIRASSIGKIMTEAKGATITPLQLKKIEDLQAKETLTDKQGQDLIDLIAKRDKAPELPETAKSYAREWVKEQLYERRKAIESKYLTKGNECEDDAIAYVFGDKYTKNEEHFENSFITGTPDIVGDDRIIDIKNSWDCFTFPLFSSELPNKDYDWQVLGYMALTGKRKGEVVFSLMDTPEHLIEREYWKDKGVSPFNLEIASGKTYTPEFQAFAKDYKYDDIPKHLRIKRFEVEYSEEKIKQIEQRVKMIRDFIDTLNY